MVSFLLDEYEELIVINHLYINECIYDVMLGVSVVSRLERVAGNSHTLNLSKNHG